MIHDRSETSLWYDGDHLRAAAILFHNDTATSNDLLQREREKGTERRGGKWKLRGPQRWFCVPGHRGRDQLFPRLVNNRELSSRPAAGESPTRERGATLRDVHALLRIGFGDLCRADKFYQASVANVARPRTPVNHAFPAIAGCIFESRRRRIRIPLDSLRFVECR